MARPTNHFKLGLFVILGFAAAVAVGIFLGALSLKKETVTYHTFFNESVQGLDVGSPVKFRGVTIGHVRAIEVAPDHRHVDVIEELDVHDIKRLGLTESGGHTRLEEPRFSIPPDLRAQLNSQGVTGVKFVAIDFLDPKSNPPLPLPFATPENHIPAATSMMKNLEDTISKAADKLPELVDAIVQIATRIDRMVAQLEADKVSEKTARALTHADEVLTSLGATVKRIEQSGITDKTSRTLDDLQVAVNKMNKVLDGAGGTTKEIEATMREVGEAAEAIRMLAEALERDPDMLVKGRGAVKGKTR